MSVKHISYLDLSVAQRRAGAAKARERLSGLLANPFLTPEQKAQVQGDLLRIDLWEAGRLDG